MNIGIRSLIRALESKKHEEVDAVLTDFIDAMKRRLEELFHREFVVKTTFWGQHKEGYYTIRFGWPNLMQFTTGKKATTHYPAYQIEFIKCDGVWLFRYGLDNAKHFLMTKQFLENMGELTPGSSAYKKFEHNYYLKCVESDLEFRSLVTLYLWHLKIGEDMKIELGKKDSQEFLDLLGNLLGNFEIYTAKRDSTAFGLTFLGPPVEIEEINEEGFDSLIFSIFYWLAPFYMAFYLPTREKPKKEVSRNYGKDYKTLRTSRKILTKWEGKCQICGVKNPLEVAHIIPRVKGGKDSLENLLLLCRNCHGEIKPTEQTVKVKHIGEEGIETIYEVAFKTETGEERKIIKSKHDLNETWEKG